MNSPLAILPYEIQLMRGKKIWDMSPHKLKTNNNNLFTREVLLEMVNYSYRKQHREHCKTPLSYLAMQTTSTNTCVEAWLQATSIPWLPLLLKPNQAFDHTLKWFKSKFSYVGSYVPPGGQGVRIAGFMGADLHNFPQLLNGYQIRGVLLWKLDHSHWNNQNDIKH